MLKILHLKILSTTAAVTASIVLLAAASYGHESNYLPKAKEQSNHLATQPEHDDGRLQDAIGAAGYLVGIAGIAFYFLASRKLRQAEQTKEPKQQS